ncbi:CD82 antigen [Echinops telfairi]|uniref:CD82 antigen n=1 Tax=Echinops telfairi TaxID=9371 RepID=A0AC55D5P2_ECHTE|nr:CD82 antigen [Echinops telfairi]
MRLNFLREGCRFSFQILGALILGFGVWIVVDRSSFMAILQTSSDSLKVGAYFFISVGSLTMLMGFLGCIGAVNEVRCLLGLYFAFLLLILVAQVAAGTFFYFKMGKVKQEMGDIVLKLIRNYRVNGSHEDSLQETWDYVQEQVECCGWVSFYNWTENAELMSRTNTTFPCSCEDRRGATDRLAQTGFCERPSNGTQGINDPAQWPVYQEGCMQKVEAWLQENLGVILGVCAGVVFIEVLQQHPPGGATASAKEPRPGTVPTWAHVMELMPFYSDGVQLPL